MELSRIRKLVRPLIAAVTQLKPSVETFVILSARIGIVEPFALFGRSALVLGWLSPTPTMAISEMPTGAYSDLSKYMATCF
jgi:hypothetical protein